MNFLLSCGADPNQMDKGGQTLLMFAVKNRRSSIVKLLLSKGVDPNQVDKNGQTPLKIALEESDRETVGLLLEKGADAKNIYLFGQTPLTFAVSQHWPYIVELLLKNGADPNQMDKNGQMPLMRAVRSGPWSMVEQLIRAGADPNQATIEGNNLMEHLFFANDWNLLKSISNKNYFNSIPHNNRLHNQMIRSVIPMDICKMLNLNKSLLYVLTLQSKGFLELYTLFASRGTILIDEASIEEKSSEIAAFLNAIESDFGFYYMYSFALISNPHIPLTKEAFMRLKALSDNQKIKDHLFIAIQGGATLEELEEAANYSGGKCSLEWLDHCIVLRKKEGVAFAEKVLREDNRAEPQIKALRL